MATLHFKATVTATPEQFVAALTDFGPGRSELFPNSTDDELEVHSQGPTEADVTEGSKGIWERLHYDWSDPDRVVLTTTDSNTWSNKAGHTYAFERLPDGTTEVGLRPHDQGDRGSRQGRRHRRDGLSDSPSPRQGPDMAHSRSNCRFEVQIESPPLPGEVGVELRRHLIHRTHRGLLQPGARPAK